MNELGEISNLFDTKPELTHNNLQIIACAGSGKTEFISNRIAYLVYKNIAKPENIVAFTFTEKAAEELKFRIRSKIRQFMGQQPDVGDMYVGTIHSFCFELLKEYVPGFRGYDVLEEGKRYAFLNSIRKEINDSALLEYLKKYEKNNYYKHRTEESRVLNTFIRCVDIVREEMLDLKEVSNCEAFCKAVNVYEEKLNEKHFLDFSNMMYLVVKELESNEDFLKNVRNKYKYITVDEYQDINPIQEKLISLLTDNGRYGNVCVVGDDDQSIYQWRSADIDNILKFKERYTNVSTYSLEVNYRSTDKIIELSNNLIKSNKKRLNKSMKPSDKKSEEGDIYKIKFDTQEEEICFIVNRIKNLIGTEWTDKNGHKRGLAYSDIAVFFRSVRYGAKQYIEAFQKENIPYTVSGIGGLFESEEVEVIFKIFSYIGDFKIRDYTKGKWKVPSEKEIYEKAKTVFTVVSLSRGNIFIKELKNLKKDFKNKNRVSLQVLYAEILNLLGITNEKLHYNEAIMFNLGRFSQAISDYEGTRSYRTYNDINRFCWFIKNYAEGSYDAGSGEDPTKVINAVQIMTLHATKGLGFPVVFMPNCVSKKSRELSPGFLNPKKFNFKRYLGSEEDERRLFYVGMTRAKKFLYITTPAKINKRKKEPSKYFNELDDKFCICAHIPDPTKRNKLPSQPSIEDYRFPTNYSELSDYIRCEYDYKMRYIYGFNPELVEALGYGKQVHNILNILHKKSQETGKVPSDEDAAELLKKHFYLRYASEAQQKKFIKAALQSILSYLNLWHEDFTLSLKTERPFEMDMDNALISGTIDLLKRKSTQENILEIIDFKTGNERKLQEELDLQVQLYTIAAREALKLNIEKAYIHYLDEKKQKRVEVLTTPKQLDLARQTVINAVKGITGRRFRRNPRNIKICEDCDWSKLCPKKE